MKALTAYPPKKESVVLRDVPVPVPGPGQVLLQILQLGIDGTDREIHRGIYGTPPPGDPYLVIGHEALARVAGTGEGVTSVAKGDLVVPTVRRPCPENCLNCRRGETDRCSTGHYREHGIQLLHGFAAEYALTDADYLVRIPDRLFDVAVLLEPLSIAESAVREIFTIQRRMAWEPVTALVVGAGPLGLLTAMVLRLRGLNVSVAARRGDESKKAQIVRQIGATYISTGTPALAGTGMKFDMIIEATGNAGAAMDVLPLLGKNGIMCLLGIYRNDRECREFGTVLTRIVLENHLIFGSVNARKIHFESGISDLQKIQENYGTVLSRLITRQIPPEEFRLAFEDREEDIKTVIRFDTGP